MQSSLYKWIMILVILAVVVAFVVVIFFGNGQNNTNNSVNLNTQSTAQEPADDEIPPFASGTVDRLDGSQVYFTGGPQGGTVGEMVAVVDSNTQIVKQVSKNGVISLEDVSVGDIEPGNSIIVYYSTQSQNQFTANKIQIIN